MHDFTGRWRITRTENWTQDFVDLVEPGFFEFDSNGLGHFVLGNIIGDLDVRAAENAPFLEFSWLGTAEGKPLCGRGQFHFTLPDHGEGTLFIHTGGQSGLSIRRSP